LPQLSIMRQLIIIVSLSCLLACHTFIFQPIKKQILGTWISTPTDPGIVIDWEFTADSLIVSLNATKLFSTPYTIQNKITKHLLIANIHTQLADTTSPFITDWIITKLNDDEMFIVSQDNPRFANEQYGFIRK